ncbi:hypothetical protein XSR1_40057 [Xenorhabdus szentirmaii DSM 16338]|uniref:Uncharacterized protein n=1 Tax=Xenorhabdus szentirmaii DSM 16338 TaxID=1427518 RepID=W1IZY8_9GAMM|nr:hypothetical protein XSR1_40057 [Xenorhabdus szentirmaii DSM 16338]
MFKLNKRLIAGITMEEMSIPTAGSADIIPRSVDVYCCPASFKLTIGSVYPMANPTRDAPNMIDTMYNLLTLAVILSFYLLFIRLYD